MTETNPTINDLGSPEDFDIEFKLADPPADAAAPAAKLPKID